MIFEYMDHKKVQLTIWASNKYLADLKGQQRILWRSEVANYTLPAKDTLAARGRQIYNVAYGHNLIKSLYSKGRIHPSCS